MPIAYREQDRVFTLSGGKVSYVLGVTSDDRLMNLYWGARVPDGAISCDLSDYPGFASFDLPVYEEPAEVPTLGSGWYGTPAVDVVNAQGDHVTDLRFAGYRMMPGKQPLKGLPATYVEKEEEAASLEIFLRDPLTDLEAAMLYTIYNDSGALTRSIRLRNSGTEPLILRGVMSASVPLWGMDYEAVYLKGGWARERTVVRVPVGQTETCLYSQRGASGHESSPFLALCRRNTDELSGEVWGVSFVYSGSFAAKVDVNNNGNVRLSMGMNPQVFQWLLEPGEEFQAPEAVLVYSAAGLSGMSQIYHRLYRTRLARGTWRDRPRPVLVNNWEATYFNFNEEKILEIVREAKKLDIELFVLDDGWFGKRDIDNCSLGDWTPDLRKLPGGIAGLSEKVHAEGLMFGIWVEPEMVSPDSDLYRAHPDWCLHVDGRTRTLERNQSILDLSRREVQDYVIEAICNVLKTGNVDYVKWDMNRNMTEYFSVALPPARRMETQHRYMLGLYRVLEAITSAFPQVLFESCSGGGGRFDGGMLFYMPQTWTSDNTDAIARLSIQYGTSFVHPLSAMGAHISAVPNHQVGRITSLQMRGDVAVCGNFGFELDLGKMTEEEKKLAKELVARTKELRGLTQTGTFTRLISPAEGKYAAWQIVSEDGNEALLCVYRILSGAATPPIRLKMAGLEEDAVYLDPEGKAWSGAALAHRGYSVGLQGDFTSRLIHFRKKA